MIYPGYIYNVNNNVCIGLLQEIDNTHIKNYSSYYIQLILKYKSFNTYDVDNIHHVICSILIIVQKRSSR